MLAKPDRIFARDFEWRHLARFADRVGAGPQLGVISGRRRPAALTEHAGAEVPHRFASWDEAVRQLLALSAERREIMVDPGTPLFREARYLLEEAADVRNSALYHSVLAAVATGNSTRGGIASYVGRKATDIGHHLNVLEDGCLLRREPDVFHPSRSVYRVCEPLINFHQVVMRPRWGLLESGRAAAVWQDARARFSGQVLGPHFEEICRAFARMEDVFGELPGEVGAGVITDPVRREQIEVDVAVFAPAMPGEPRRARELLAAKKFDVRDTVLACYSGVGFDGELRSEPDVRAIGLGELYG